MFFIFLYLKNVLKCCLNIMLLFFTHTYVILICNRNNRQNISLSNKIWKLKTIDCNLKLHLHISNEIKIYKQFLFCCVNKKRTFTKINVKMRLYLKLFKFKIIFENQKIIYSSISSSSIISVVSTIRFEPFISFKISCLK